MSRLFAIDVSERRAVLDERRERVLQAARAVEKSYKECREIVAGGIVDHIYLVNLRAWFQAWSDHVDDMRRFDRALSTMAIPSSVIRPSNGGMTGSSGGALER